MGRNPSITTEGAGDFWTTRKGKTHSMGELIKARAHWARKSALRKQPGRCGRCAAPWISETHKHCDDCRAYARRRQHALRVKPITVDEGALAKLERRIAGLEHNMAMMQLDGRLQYKKGFAAGGKAARNALKKALTIEQNRESKYFDAYPTITKQELASINHAYDSEGRQ